MSSAIVQAVRIYLKAVIAENTALGIYTSGTSEIRLSEVPLSGVSLPWTSGLILEDGIGAIKESSDITTGGAVASYTGLNIILVDTGRWLLSLKNLGVYLSGCKCEIYEYRGTEVDSDSVSEKIVFTGIIEDIDWNETQVGKPIKNAYYKRNSLMSVPLSEGSSDIKPITFGAFYPPDSTTVNNLAKFLRSINVQDESIYTNEYFNSSVTSSIKIFPLTQVPATGHVLYQFEIFGTTTIVYNDVRLLDVYMLIVSGVGKGQIRKVSNFFDSFYSPTSIVTCTVKDAFYTELVDTDTADPGHVPPIVANTRSWVQFIKIDRNFIDDFWPCKDFLSSLSGTAVANPELFSFASDEEKYNKIADYGFVVKDSAENNALDIDGQQYSENIDKLQSSIISPITNIALESVSDVSIWGTSSILNYASYTKKVDGVYWKNSSFALNVDSNSFVYSANSYDKDSTTYAEHALVTKGLGGADYCTILKFNLPAFPKGSNVSKIFIGIKSLYKSDSAAAYDYSKTDSTKGGFLFVLRRFAHTKDDDIVLKDKNLCANFYGSGVKPSISVDDMPDFYFSDAPATANINYYKSSLPKTISGYSGMYDALNGYALFEIPGCDEETYNTYLEGGLIRHCHLDPQDPDDLKTENLKIYELAIIFELSETTISKEVYSPAAGRVYDDTWSTRKTATDLINNPVDIIEHCNRLKDFSETGETGIAWGIEYATSAKIKISGDGSFDASNLTAAKAFRPAFQIFNKDKAYSNEIIKKLCQTYNLCSRIDESGNECIYTLEKTSPSETILFSHLSKAPGNVIEPKSQDVYCEPSVNYLYNVATNKFEKSLSINSISSYSAGTWATHSSGFANQTDAESVLNLCTSLYSKFNCVEKCPSDFSEQNTITTYADALAFLIMKLNWMGKRRISISVFYDTYLDLSLTTQFHIFQHVNLKLPHQTYDYPVECIIENCIKNKNKNSVQLDLVLLDDITLPT